MNRIRRRSRSLFVALGILGLSAGLVAARELPQSADQGLGTATEAAGKAVPQGPPAEPAQSSDEDAPAAGERKANHGSFVSDAAKGDVPDGYDNRGQYVSSVARGGQGKPEAAAGGQEHAAAAPGRAVSAAAKAKDKGQGQTSD